MVAYYYLKLGALGLILHDFWFVMFLRFISWLSEAVSCYDTSFFALEWHCGIVVTTITIHEIALITPLFYLYMHHIEQFT